MVKFGTRKSCADSCVFYESHGRDLLIMVTYVDDILMISANNSLIAKLKIYLSAELKSLGRVSFCLGVEFRQEENCICMSQKRYIQEILGRFGMLETNPVSTPLDPNQKLRPCLKEESEPDAFPQRTRGSHDIRCHLYKRPDISFAISYLSQFSMCYDSSRPQSEFYVI